MLQETKAQVGTVLRVLFEQKLGKLNPNNEFLRAVRRPGRVTYLVNDRALVGEEILQCPCTLIQCERMEKDFQQARKKNLMAVRRLNDLCDQVRWALKERQNATDLNDCFDCV